MKYPKLLTSVLALILYFFLLPKFTYAAPAPVYEWTIATGGTGGAGGNSTAVDGSGNVYVSGWLSGIVNFGPGEDTATRTSQGDYDIFLSKYQSDGTRVWTKTMGGSSYDYGNSTTVDTSENIFVTGYFSNTVDFGPGGDTASRTSQGSGDIFLSKYQSDGTRVWTKTMGGSGEDDGYSIAVDGSGNVYITGDFSGTVNFGPGGDTASRTSQGGRDFFLSKYQSDGTRVWTKTPEGGGGDDSASSTAVDGDGNVYVTGFFYNTVNFGPGGDTASRTSQGLYDTFLTKYQSDGTRVWTKTIGGISGDRSFSTVVDGNGDVYVVGSFWSTVNFGPGGDTASRTSQGNNDIYLSKYQSDGTRVWTKTIGGSEYDVGIFTTIDGSDNVYITGYFGGSVDFNPGGTSEIIAANSDWDDSMFVTSYDSLGNYLWTKTASGGNETDGYGIAIDSNNNIYVTGDVYGTADFDPQGTHDYITGDPDNGAMTLTKYSLDLIPPSLLSFSPSSGSTINDSTPTITFSTNENATCRLSLTDNSYTEMAEDITCTGEGTTSQSCIAPSLGTDGAKTVYISCIDEHGNEHTAANNTALAYILDTTGPTDEITINDGDTYTKTRDVTLILSASDSLSTVSQMLLSNDSAFTGSTWEAYTTTKDWTLSLGDGTKTVYAKFKDSVGNISTVYSDTITLDTQVVLNTLTIGTQSITTDLVYWETAEVRPIFTGTTDPLATVTITIHSDPITGTTQADNQGKWSWTPTVDIPTGEHTVTISSTDPLGNTTNYDFTLKVLGVSTTRLPNTGNAPAIILLSVLSFLLSGLGVRFLLRLQKTYTRMRIR